MVLTYLLFAAVVLDGAGRAAERILDQTYNSDSGEHGVAAQDAGNCAFDSDALEFDKPTRQKNCGKSKACWVLSIVEDMRYQGVIKSFFDNSWITVQTTEDGEITWMTHADYQGSFSCTGDASIPAWQRILESIFEHWRTDGQSAQNINFQTSIGFAPRDCEGEHKGAHKCRAYKIGQMLNMIHTNIVVKGKLCTISADTKTVEECARKAESPTTCIAFSVDKKAGKNSMSHALAVRHFGHAEKEKGKMIWELYTYNQQKEGEKAHGKYICDPSEWGSNTKSICTSEKNPRNYFKDVFRYTISGLPMVPGPDIAEQAESAGVEIDLNAPSIFDFDPHGDFE